MAVADTLEIESEAERRQFVDFGQIKVWVPCIAAKESSQRRPKAELHREHPDGCVSGPAIIITRSHFIMSEYAVLRGFRELTPDQSGSPEIRETPQPWHMR